MNPFYNTNEKDLWFDEILIIVWIEKTEASNSESDYFN